MPIVAWRHPIDLSPTCHEVSMNKAMPAVVSVLYVEDDTGTREMVTNMLEKNGFNCIVARDGHEGLELYRRYSPDIVLSDIMMPEMSGLEMARAIRNEFPEAQFIFMTALGDSTSILEAIDIGVTQYVVKPAHLSKVLAAISNCVVNIRLKSQAQRVGHLEAIGLLTGGLAHDVNNLLQMIMGYVSLAKKRVNQDDAAYTYLAKAESISKDAGALGQRLRTLSRGESALKQKGPLSPSIINGVTAALYGTGIIPSFDLPPDIPQVTFDKAQIEQVVTHLTANAVDAMPLGGKLEVATRISSLSGESSLLLAPGDYVHVTFSDTGKGIPSEDLPRLFDPYFTTKAMDFHKGQGLGLSICRAIIGTHGGQISAGNTPGSGATFNIWLPVAEQSSSTF